MQPRLQWVIFTLLITAATLVACGGAENQPPKSAVPAIGAPTQIPSGPEPNAVATEKKSNLQLFIDDCHFSSVDGHWLTERAEERFGGLQRPAPEVEVELVYLTFTSTQGAEAYLAERGQVPANMQDFLGNCKMINEQNLLGGPPIIVTGAALDSYAPCLDPGNRLMAFNLGNAGRRVRLVAKRASN